MKKFLLIFICSILLVQGCASKDFSEKNGSIEDKYGLKDRSYLEPKPISKDQILQQLAQLKEESLENQEFSEFQRIDQRIDEVTEPVQHNLNVWSIKYYQNITDSKIADQFDKAMSVAENVNNEANSIRKIHLTKNYGEKVAEQLKQDAPLQLREIQQLKSKEQENQLLELREQLVDVQNEFTQKRMSEETIVDGMMYNVSDLENIKDSTKREVIEKQYYQELLDLLNQQISIEKKIALLLNYKSVPEMYFDEHQRPYSLEEASDFVQYTNQYFVPVAAKIFEKIAGSSNSQNYDGDELTKPIKSIIEKDIGPILEKTNTEMYDVWRLMLEKKLYDTEPRKNKIDNMAQVVGANPPFLIGNFENTQQDLQTFIHEFGHFFATSLVDKNLVALTSNDVHEIYSQSLEMLLSSQVGNLTTEASKNFLARLFINQLVLLPKELDLQLKMYAEDHLTLEKMTEINQSVFKDFSNITDGDNHGWVNNLMVDRPLAGLEYFLSGITAIQLFENASNDYQSAVDQYVRMIKNPNQQDLSQIALKVGLKDPKDETTIAHVADIVTRILKL